MDLDKEKFVNSFDYKITSQRKNGSLITITLRSIPHTTFYKFGRNSLPNDLILTLGLAGPNELSITVRDEGKELWELPQHDPYPHDDDITTHTFPYDKTYQIRLEHRPFSLEVVRTATDECIFSTKGMPFFLSHTFTVFATPKTTNRVFGLGERAYDLRLRKGTYTIYTQDNPGNIEDGTPGHSTYGHHPMYLMQEKSGKFHILLLRNTVPLDVEVSKRALTFKMVRKLSDLP